MAKMKLWARVQRRYAYMNCYSRILARMVSLPRERKYMFNWMASVREHPVNYLLRRPMPFICYTAWEYIRETIPNDAAVFEYGSGGSTLFWLQEMRARCVSIEHNPQWYDLVRDRVEQLKLSDRLDYRLIPPDLSSNADARTLDPFSPSAYRDEKVQGNFEHYVKQIDQFSDSYFDVVVVDGRSRPACIAHAVSKVRSEGLLIVDNSDRPYFTHLHEALADFTEQRFIGVVPTALELSQTSVFIRSKTPEPNNGGRFLATTEIGK